MAAPADEGRQISDPATGEVIGSVIEHPVDDLDAAVAAAKAAQPGWAVLVHAKRIEIMNDLADRIATNTEALAEL